MHLANSRLFLGQGTDALHPMKIYLFLAFLTVASAFAADAMKFVSPDKSTTLVVDKSGRRDIIELQSRKRVHRLFYEDLDSIFKTKIAEAFNASLNKVGKIVLPTFTSARWTSPYEVEIKGESVVSINVVSGSLLPEGRSFLPAHWSTASDQFRSNESELNQVQTVYDLVETRKMTLSTI